MVLLLNRVKKNFIRLLLAVLLWILFAYNYLINYRYTWYYRYNRNEKDLHIEMNRQFQSAQNYWNQLLRKEKFKLNSYNFSSDICTILITSPRYEHPTLHYTLSSLVSSMTYEDKISTKIFIYNTAKPSSLHKHAEQLSQAEIPFLEVIHLPSIDVEIVQQKTQSDQWAFRETIDYLSALSFCEKQKPNNILILEDDLLFTKNFFSKLRTIISNNQHSRCSLIKLFKTDYWDGWERKHAPYLILLSLSISLLINFLFILLDEKFSLRSIRLYTKSLFSIVIFFSFTLLWFVFILILILSVNRQNFQFLFGIQHGLHIMKSSTAGTLAQVYSSNVVQSLQSFILEQVHSNKSVPIDILLNDFFEKHQSTYLQCHAIPDLVNHIGVYSSNKNKNQGNFLSMKQSGTFEYDQAAFPIVSS